MAEEVFEWTVVPYEAVGVLRYGMSGNDVAALLGPPRTRRDVGGFILETRHRLPEIVMPRITYENDGLFEAEFFVEQRGIICAGVPVDLYELSTTISALMERETARGGQAYRGPDIIIFTSLGILLGGIDWEEPGERSLVAFARDRLDGVLAREGVKLLP